MVPGTHNRYRANIPEAWRSLAAIDRPIHNNGKNIDAALESLFAKEKDFKPHLTLARIRFIKDKNGFLENIKETSKQKS